MGLRFVHTHQPNTKETNDTMNASMTVAKKMAVARGLSLKMRMSAPRPARTVVVRAAPEPPQESSPAPASTESTPPPPPPPVKKDVSFGEAMAFSGPAPETINGRLAMLGFTAALGAEASSGETVFQQIADAEPSILFAFVMFAAASLIPTLKGVKEGRKEGRKEGKKEGR